MGSKVVLNIATIINNNKNKKYNSNEEKEVTGGLLHNTEFKDMH